VVIVGRGVVRRRSTSPPAAVTRSLAGDGGGLGVVVEPLKKTKVLRGGVEAVVDFDEMFVSGGNTHSPLKISIKK
jgi:hypothetical protein